MKILKDMIEVWKGNIINAPAQLGVDAIVNAANPTLMGSTEHVDGAIHSKIDELQGEPGFFKKSIRKELENDENADEKKIRCQRGKVIRTSGYQLCPVILHTVGPDTDAMACKPKVCSSSVMNTLEMCYKNIIMDVLEKNDIKNIAVPIISSGNYGIEFDLAFRTALTSVYNTLLNRKKEDLELFDYITLEKVYFVVWEGEPEKCEIANKILKDYRKCFEREVKVVSKDSKQSQKEYYKDVKLYDNKRGYFSVVRSFRMVLILIRQYAFPFTAFLKDTFGKEDWLKRRKVIELATFYKMLLPVLAYGFIRLCRDPFVVNTIPMIKDRMFFIFLAVVILMVYCILDTVTYLVSLIIMADIQKPSANTIRSMVMLCINYIEVSMDFSVIYYCIYNGKIKFWEAVAFGILGENAMRESFNIWYDYLIVYLNEGVKFFFLTLAFGYFSNHLRPRRFLDDVQHK